MVCNFLIAIAVHGSISNELDPLLHLGNPGIHSVAGTLTAIADYANLGEPVVCQVGITTKKDSYHIMN